ncbi:MAG: hypothetical protein O7H41_00210 [Planctomycetota bacterium]|nr:hypothetical protein [Planctomycetota bacterium]
MTGDKERGAALMMLLLLSFGLVLTTAYLVSQAVAELRDQTSKRLLIQARYEGLGELAAARHEVEGDSSLLDLYADTGDPIPDTNVMVHEIVDKKVYELEVTVEYEIDGGAVPITDTLVEVAIVKASGGAGLSKFAILSGEGTVEYWKDLYAPNQGVGGTLYGYLTYFGRMDSDHNHDPDFGLDGWFIWDDIYDWDQDWHGWHNLPPQWKPNRADWFQGEDWNIKPHDWSGLDQVVFDDIASIADLAADADYSYTSDVAITFGGTTITITPAGGPSETYNISDVSIIYTSGSITSIGGDVNGQITVAADGGVTITDSIVYVDDQGDHAMLGGDGSADFEPNTAYDGDSNLGVFSEGNIILDYDVPTATELNGLYFSRDGSITIEGYEFDYIDDPDYKAAWPDPNLPARYTGTFGIKDSLRIFGSVQYKNFFWPYSFDINDLFTGAMPYPPVDADDRFLDRKMIYDTKLKDSPPPGYPGYGGGDAAFLGIFTTKEE